MGCGNSTTLNTQNKKISLFPDLKIDPTNFVSTNPRPFLDIYKIGKLLGSTRFGEVRQVTLKTSGEERAVKIYKKNTSNTDLMNKQLMEELNILKTLDHPNIIRIYEFFEDQRRYYIVIENCQGGDLFEEISKREYLDEDLAATILHQIFSAVAYLHSKRIAHRDLKPENILLEDRSPELNIKIADFGDAVRFSPGSKLRASVGSTFYIAPEVLKGDYTEKCDVWSCGVLMFMLLCGAPPFNGENNEQILGKIKKRAFSFSAEVWKNVSSEAKEFISKLLAKPATRLSALEALQDPWLQRKIKRENTSKKIVLNVLNNLKNFQKNSRLKEAVKSFIATQCLTNSYAGELRKVFREMDGNGDGKLSKQELNDYFVKEMGESQEVNRIFELVDMDKNGYLEYLEFIKASMDVKTLNNKKFLKRAFDLFDKDGSGTITADELKRVLAVGSVREDEDWNKVIKEISKNREEEIDFNEFEAIVISKTN